MSSFAVIVVVNDARNAGDAVAVVKELAHGALKGHVRVDSTAYPVNGIGGIDFTAGEEWQGLR